MTTSASGFVEWICRGYKQKSSALFDLLDNADDATVKASSVTNSKWIATKDRIMSPDRVTINPMPVVCITNGGDAIKPITHCLSFAQSDKKNTEQIGENGVGLKQSVVYLANSGLVISRYNKPQADGKGSVSTIGVALISKDLNLSSAILAGGGPKFPRLECVLSAAPTLSSIQAAIKTADLGDWPLAKWTPFLYGFDIAECVLDAICDANLSSGAVALAVGGKPAPFFRVMLICKKPTETIAPKRKRKAVVIYDSDYDSDYETGHPDAGSDSDDDSVADKAVDDPPPPPPGDVNDDWIGVDAKKTVDFIAREYPLRYLDSLFDVSLTCKNHKAEKPMKVAPLQWHRKFVYLCKHLLTIDSDLETFPKPFNVYLGYDPIYRSVKESRLFVYSRGRLMTTNNDFRKLLGLKNYEADYQQGLTVIVEDINCQLTLDPTKEGFRDCQSLWSACYPVVRSYYSLTKRLVGCVGVQRHNLIMQKAFKDNMGAVYNNEKKLYRKLDALELNVLPKTSVNKKKVGVTIWQEKSIVQGKHTVQLIKPVVEKPMPKGYSLEVVPLAGAPAVPKPKKKKAKVNDWDDDDVEDDWEDEEEEEGAGRKSMRKRVAPKKVIDAMDFSDNDEERVRNSHGKQADANNYNAKNRTSVSVKTTKNADDFYESDCKEIAKALLDLVSGMPAFLKPEFDTREWKRGVTDATRARQFKELLEQFEDNIAEGFKCRKWLGDMESLCVCERCGVACRDVWLEKLDGSRGKTMGDRKRHLLEMLNYMNHFCTDGDWVIAGVGAKGVSSEEVRRKEIELHEAKREVAEGREDIERIRESNNGERQQCVQTIAKLQRELREEKEKVRALEQGEKERLEAAEKEEHLEFLEWQKSQGLAL